MPVHDWTRVEAGTFHDFHTAWITHLKEILNGGVLPAGYYAMSEQWAGRSIADVLTLEAPARPTSAPEAGGKGVALAETPPRVRRRLTAETTARALRRTLAIRHRSGHRVVAFLEIVSPANKDRPAHVSELADKVENALCEGVHVLLIDILPPGRHDSAGMHGVIWERFDEAPYPLPPAEPFTLASYVGGAVPEAWVEHMDVGDELVSMPLFLDPAHYVNVPLEETYAAAFSGIPAVWRDRLEAGEPEAD